MTVLRPYLLSLLVVATVSAQAGQTDINTLLSGISGDPLALRATAQPTIPFDRVGRRFAFLGQEDGSFEAWAFPLKLVRAFRFSFLLTNATTPIPAEKLVQRVIAAPAATILTFVHPVFTAKLAFVVPPNESGGLILLHVDAIRPLSVVCGFHPVLEPMWPAGLGGQYAWWHNDLHAYVISEPTGQNHALVGCSQAEKISNTPAHTLSESPHEFVVKITDPEAFRQGWIPIVLAGGKGSFEGVKSTYERLAADPATFLEQSQDHVKALLDSTLHVDCPDDALSQAVEWAKISFDNLLVTNPDLGTGLVAGWGPSGTGGRPGFGWFFGGDACINSFGLTGLGHWGTVRQALTFLQRWQRKDGKIPHEISQAAGYVDWFHAYHYAFIHADTTPFYLIAMGNYVRWSGDTTFAKTSWDSIEKAYRWCLSTDLNGDGLMDNKAAGLGALEYGSLLGIQTDVYLAAVWARAVTEVAYLARLTGHSQLAARAVKRAAQIAKVFDRAFWSPEIGQYAYAFDTRGNLVNETTPWCAVGAMWSLGTPERRLASLRRVARADLTTDWGVRMLSTTSTRYEPLNYNYGAAWPFVTGWVATAEFRNDLPWAGLQNLNAIVALVYENQLGHVNEVFSGATHTWPQASVPHQGFSTNGYVLPILWGMLGLEADAVTHRVTFAPAFPATWRKVEIRNLQIGNTHLDLRIERKRGFLRLVATGRVPEGFHMNFAPILGPGVKVQQMRINSNARDSRVRTTPRSTQPFLQFELTGQDTVEIRFRPAPEIVPPRGVSELGDRPHEVRFIDVYRQGKALIVHLEGRAGTSTQIPLVNAELVERAEGGSISGNTLYVEFPAKGKDFLQKTVRLIVRE